jgi:hypothetical protein
VHALSEALAKSVAAANEQPADKKLATVDEKANKAEGDSECFWQQEVGASWMPYL